jgi:hypothetical protein
MFIHSQNKNCKHSILNEAEKLMVFLEKSSESSKSPVSAIK